MSAQDKKLLHVLKPWEPKWGHISIRKKERPFYPESGKRITVILESQVLTNRHIDWNNRMWLGVSAMRNLSPNDVLIITKVKNDQYVMIKKN